MSEKEFTDEQILQNFLLDIQCLDELLPWTNKFNLFDVLKISRLEIRHSNVLAWLLETNENHGFGDEDKSYWGSTNTYAYWFDIGKECVRGVFELAGLNVPKKSFKTMQKIISVLKPNDSRTNSFNEKKVFTTKWYRLNDVRDD